MEKIAMKEFMKKIPYTNENYKEWSGMIAKIAREDIERNLGERVITKQNRLNYEYKDELEIETK